ncbi:hypothetical protein BJV82DRAFT_654571 [Fennellomyces sp. T-0311]|nr:hypothetical protein BJV82DRAFT_654571 [Fennellomyces sp. T-0311]
MSKSMETKHVSEKEPATVKKSRKRQSREVSRKKKASTMRESDGNILQYVSLIILDKNASITNAVEEWHAVRHPRLPLSTPPRYFVNKQGQLCSKVAKGLKPLKRIKGRPSISYILCSKEKSVILKLEEIMVYTFSRWQFDDRIHYIFYKDGQQDNCTWDNLIVCDLPTMQRLEIARLEKLHQGTKYIVVSNVHDTLTFARYLVSDDGKIYSLVKRQYIGSSDKVKTKYRRVILAPDTDTRQPFLQTVCFKISEVVMQSFKGRRHRDDKIRYINGNVWDNSLDNLAYMTPARRKDTVTQNEQNTPEKTAAQPVMPISKETKGPVSHYEVLDMAHVPKMAKSELLALLYINSLYAIINIFQGSKSDNWTTAGIQHTKIQIPCSTGMPLLTTTRKGAMLPSDFPGIGTTVAFSIWKGNIQCAARSTNIQTETLCHLWDQVI